MVEILTMATELALCSLKPKVLVQHVLPASCALSNRQDWSKVSCHGMRGMRVSVDLARTSCRQHLVQGEDMSPRRVMALPSFVREEPDSACVLAAQLGATFRRPKKMF